MSVSTLSSVLSIISAAKAPVSLGYIAHQLDISPEMADNMIQYWVRKGKIAPVEQEADCGSCGVNDSCPFIYRLPTSYELVGEDDQRKLPLIDPI